MSVIDLRYAKLAKAAEFNASNVVLALSQLGLETDTGNLKLGDGRTQYRDLGYFSGGTTRTFRGAMANQAEMLALTGLFISDWVTRDDEDGAIYELVALPASTLDNWLLTSSAGATLQTGALAPSTTAAPNATAVLEAIAAAGGGGGGSALPTLVTYGLAFPLDGNKRSADHNMASAETLTLGAVAEGSSYYVNMIGDGNATHKPTSTEITLLGGTFNTDLGAVNYVSAGYRSGRPYWIIQDTGVTIVLAPVFTAQSAPGGNVSTAYNYDFNATGAVSFAVASGSLPAGLSLNTSTGVVSGTPTTAAAYTFVISATNTGGTTNSTSQSVTIGIALPVFTAQSSPGGTESVFYTYDFDATGATSFSVFSGSLPAGVTLNTSTGVISGTPTTAGSSAFVIRATNAGGNTDSTSQSVTIASGASHGDTFTRADSAVSIGTPSDGGSPWVIFGTATVGISSNKAYMPIASGEEIVARDTGSAVFDHSIDVLYQSGSGSGNVVRVIDQGKWILAMADPGGSNGWQVYSRNSSYTLEATMTGPTPVHGVTNTIRITLDGADLLTLYVDGVSIGTVTIAVHAGATYAGFRQNGASTTTRFDNQVWV